MEKHITALGVLYIVFGILGIIPALIVAPILMGIGWTTPDPDAAAMLSGLGIVISTFLLMISLPGVLGGIFLLKRRNWARILLLVLGVLNLLNLPFGTILGIYTLWALLQDEARPLFA